MAIKDSPRDIQVLSQIAWISAFKDKIPLSNTKTYTSKLKKLCQCVVELGGINVKNKTIIVLIYFFLLISHNGNITYQQNLLIDLFKSTNVI